MSNSYDPMQIADGTQQIAEAYAGIRAAFIQKGFTEEQAGDLAVATVQQSAAEAWKVALGKEER